MLNEELRKAQEYWVENIFIPYMGAKNSDCNSDGSYRVDSDGNVKLNKNRKGQVISCPFYMGLTEDYINKVGGKPRLMVIGQEARHYGSWAQDREKPNYMSERSQLWSNEYMRTQLDKKYKSDEFDDLDYKKAGFWRAIRQLDKKFCVCWNNVDKVYYALPKKSETDKEEYKGTLTYYAEKELSKQYGEDKKSLLQREIEIAKPDILLFLTGPDYYLSMATAFGIDPQKLKGKLNTHNNKIVEVTGLLGTDIPAYWTYHPCYFSINGAKEVVQFSKVRLILDEK